MSSVFCKIAKFFIWPYLIFFVKLELESVQFPLYAVAIIKRAGGFPYEASEIIPSGSCGAVRGADLCGDKHHPRTDPGDGRLHQPWRLRRAAGRVPAWAATGAAAGGIGSALADILSGYAVFAPGTFVIKALIAVIAAAILKALGSKTKAAPIVASIAGEAWMVLGYFLYESIFLGYGLTAAGSIGGNAIQAVAGVILATALYAVLSKVPQIKKAAA